MRGMDGQHITVEMVMWLPAFLRLCLPWLHDHTRQICSCAHIYACAKLPSGEEMLLAYFEFTKSSSGFRCFRAVFLLYSNCVIVPSRRLKNSVVVPIYRLGA